MCFKAALPISMYLSLDPLLSRVTRSSPSPGPSNQDPFAKQGLPYALLRLPSEISLSRPGTRAHQRQGLFGMGSTTIHPETQTRTPGISLDSSLSPCPNLVYYHTLLFGLLRIFLNLSTSQDPHGCCLVVALTRDAASKSRSDGMTACLAPGSRSPGSHPLCPRQIG